MTDVAQPDDNMIPGQTYTFQLDMTGFHFPPSANDVQGALKQYGPTFLGDLAVTSPFTTTIYNCQFNYTGDGSDVIQDVGNQLDIAVQAGLNLPMTFKGAVKDTAANITITPQNAIGQGASAIGDAVNSAIDKITKTTAQGAQNLLTPIEVAVGIVVILVVILIFTAGKSGGVSASATGFNLGGNK